jgi:hypothetical protein
VVTVLILGGPDDDHAAHMLNHLRSRGADAEFLDTRHFPASLTIAFDPASGAGRFRLPGGRVLDFAAVSAVYWRQYHGVPPSRLPDPEQAYVAANDARGLLEAVLIRLPCRWVNGWRAYQSHQTKPAQLAAVAALGVPVPATVVGNDAEAVRAFAAAHPRCIFKPVQGGAHARPLTAAQLTDANLRNLAHAPVTVQEEVPGTNVRVFVAGERVLGCVIRSEALDYRDDPDPRIDPHPLPAEVSGWCVRAARALDLVWTGIDLRLTPDGRYVFLEANPSPMFLGFEYRTRLPLTESLAALLTAPAGSGQGA